MRFFSQRGCTYRCWVMKDTYQLGEMAAKAIGFTPASQHTYYSWHGDPILLKRWSTKTFTKPRKGEFVPDITSMPNSILIQKNGWRVTFYVSLVGGRQGIDAVGIIGEPDERTMQSVFRRWNEPDLERVYKEKLQWLHDNPMFRQRPTTSASGKTHLHPSQTDID